MKTRRMIVTEEAQKIQDQLNHAKHGRGRELLKKKLKVTYLESMVDLQNNRAMVMIDRNYMSEVVEKHLKQMCESILHEYESIKVVNVYGRDAILDPEFKSKFYTSSVIQPEIEGTADIVPTLVVNGKDAIHANKEEKEGIDMMHNIRDTVYDIRKADWFAPVYSSGDREAGQIKIIVEAIPN